MESPFLFCLLDITRKYSLVKVCNNILYNRLLLHCSIWKSIKYLILNSRMPIYLCQNVSYIQNWVTWCILESKLKNCWVTVALETKFHYTKQNPIQCILQSNFCSFWNQKGNAEQAIQFGFVVLKAHYKRHIAMYM